MDNMTNLAILAARAIVSGDLDEARSLLADHRRLNKNTFRLEEVRAIMDAIEFINGEYNAELDWEQVLRT